MNAYPTLQTSSYLFMESDTTKQACVGVVKVSHLHSKNPSQHAADLQMLSGVPVFICIEMLDYIDKTPLAGQLNAYGF